jgi:hypothetical protein
MFVADPFAQLNWWLVVVALKSLIVLAFILFLAIWIAQRSILVSVGDRKVLRTLSELCFGVLFLAFLSHSFWVYLVLGSFLVFRVHDKVNPAAIVAALFFCVPFYQRAIYVPGGDSSVAFVSLQHFAILLLIVSTKPLKGGDGVSSWTDKFLLGWIMYQAVTFFLASTIPHAIKTVV